ncbi:hypothetical protein [Staphylococcus sp. Marseille-Q6910]|uniref:hypothetical protein n=1 Tax=Staphylococcus sp. Marseille-Q6910 TaxID=2937990 RepID=UPI002041F664|nr:hypothetical protein [Staphylococcus sp. Marseille-Q6910]
MKIKQNWVGITVVLVILVIFLLITFAKANEGLDLHEQHDLDNSRHQYLSKGA